MVTDAAAYRVVEIDDVFVNGRHRKDLGDIPALAASIADVGLLQPIVISPMLRLIAGARRLAAFKHLGRDKIPAVVASDLAQAAELLRAERDENTCRKDLTPEEAVDLGEALEEVEREAAKARADKGRKKGGDAASGKVSRKLESTPENRTRDAVGRAVGMSGKTYEKAKAVVKAARESPEKFGLLKEEMNRTGKVNGAHKKLKELTKPRPAKTYPASDQFMKVMGDLACELELVRQNYGSVKEMFAHADWKRSETLFAKQFIAAFCRTFTELNEELQDVAK